MLSPLDLTQLQPPIHPVILSPSPPSQSIAYLFLFVLIYLRVATGYRFNHLQNKGQSYEIGQTIYDLAYAGIMLLSDSCLHGSLLSTTKPYFSKTKQKTKKERLSSRQAVNLPIRQSSRPPCFLVFCLE